jgi:hypothetical protein
MTSTRSFRSLVAAAGAALALVFGAAPAQARDVNWSIGVHSPGVSVGVGSGGYPVYVAPAPVYVAPRPVYVEPRPVYYSAPAYYAPPPPPAYYYRDRGHRHHRHDRHRHHDRYDRYDRDDRGHWDGRR